MSVYGMTSVTVGVSSIGESLRLFRDVMGLQVDSDAETSRALQDAWGLPAHVTARLVELSCRGYPAGHLRLVQYSPAATEAVRLDHGKGAVDASTDIGPKAIDFYVPPPMSAAVEAITGAGYAFRSEPIRYEVGDIESEECLFSGPDGVPALERACDAGATLLRGPFQVGDRRVALLLGADEELLELTQPN